jgi:hypothetical protein
VHLVRSGIAVGGGFVVFSILFRLLGPNLGAILPTVAGGLMAGYLTARIAQTRELLHGGATAGLTAASLIVQPVLTLQERVLVAAIAAAAITAGAWVRGQARVARVNGPDHRVDGEERS